MKRCVVAALLFAAAPVPACVLPDDGQAPMRRMVGRVKYLPETEAWRSTLPAGAIPSYLLQVQAPVRIAGRCYWPVEVSAAGARWNLFYVSADGKLLRVAHAGDPPVTLRAWRTRLSGRPAP